MTNEETENKKWVRRGFSVRLPNRGTVDPMRNSLPPSPRRNSVSDDAIVDLCTSTYISLPKSFHPSPRSNGTPQYCILAGFVLGKVDRIGVSAPPNSRLDNLKCVTLATGSKCLPKSKLSLDGQALHDSHAEVLARRGFVRWIYEEILRSQSDAFVSDWIERCSGKDGVEPRYRLQETVKVFMYISTLPCKDIEFQTQFAYRIN